MGLLLLAALCAGCGSGTYGAAVTTLDSAASRTRSSAPVVPTATRAGQFGGSTNLVPNGSFEHGRAPWQQAFGSSFTLTKSPTRFGKLALLVRPKNVLEPFGAKATIVGHPLHDSRYGFHTWADASRDLDGSNLVVQLQALRPNGYRWVNVAKMREPLARGWHRYSVGGRVAQPDTVAVRALVFVGESVSLNSWLALDGAVAARSS